MAIQLDLPQSQYGVSFPSAYFRITNARVIRAGGGDIRFGVMIDLAGYATNPQGDLLRDIDARRYNCPLDEVEIQSGDNFLARCYEWVMAQPDMVGAIAV